MRPTNDAKFNVDGFAYEPDTGHIFHKGQRRGFEEGQKWYMAVERCGVRVMFHRLAWRLHYGQWPASEIDHINRNKQDNRIVNLRLATRSQNISNAPANKNCKSGERGVFWHPIDRKWGVTLSYQRKKFSKYASHKISAILAARLIRRLLHGEFGASECNEL